MFDRIAFVKSGNCPTEKRESTMAKPTLKVFNVSYFLMYFAGENEQPTNSDHSSKSVVAYSEKDAQDWVRTLVSQDPAVIGIHFLGGAVVTVQEVEVAPYPANDPKPVLADQGDDIAQGIAQDAPADVLQMPVAKGKAANKVPLPKV